MPGDFQFALPNATFEVPYGCPRSPGSSTPPMRLGLVESRLTDRSRWSRNARAAIVLSRGITMPRLRAMVVPVGSRLLEMACSKEFKQAELTAVGTETAEVGTTKVAANREEVN